MDVQLSNNIQLYGNVVTVFPADPTLYVEVYRAPDNGSGAANNGAAVSCTVLPPGPLGGITFIDPLPNDGAKRYYKTRHIDLNGNVSLFTAYSDGQVPTLISSSNLANPMAAFGAIVDALPPATKYEMRMANTYPDPDTLDGMQSYIDFPATTNFMRVGQTPLAIVSSTNATPINVQATGHGYSTNDRVTIRGHLVNTNANGTAWTITVVDNNNFTLNGSVGNGVGVATGHAVKLSLIIAPNGALTVFATVIATVLNAITATITGLLSALGGLLVRNSLQHSTIGGYGDTTVKRVLLENDSFKLMGDVGGGAGTNNEVVRIGDYSVSGPTTVRSTTNLNDPATGSRGWVDPETSPSLVTMTFTSNTAMFVPQDWNNASNTIEAWGAGGNGAASLAGTRGGGGGGGGEYRKAVNVSLTPGASLNIIATAGFDASAGGVIAKKGANAVGATGGAGGTGGTGAGGNFNGGAGGLAAQGVNNRAGGGGGGCAGSAAVGANGVGGSAGTPGAGGAGGAPGGGSAGTGGSPGNPGGAGTPNGGGGGGGGPTFAGGAGGVSGGGGGGGGTDGISDGAGAAGSGGVVIITYTPVADNGINLISQSTNGTSTVAAGSRLYQKLGDATEGANVPSYDGNYQTTFRLALDVTQWGILDTGTAVATVTAEYATDGTGTTWTALGGSWSLTYIGAGGGGTQFQSQVFTPTLVVPGSPAHVWFRFTTTISVSSGPGKVASAVLECFATAYKTDDYAATWFTAGAAVTRRGYKGFSVTVADKFLLEDGSGAYLLEDGSGDYALEGLGRPQPHASWAPVAAPGADLTEGELQAVGGTIHSVGYRDDEAVRYPARLLGVEVNKTTAAAGDTKITTGIKLLAGRINVANRIVRIKAGGSVGANAATVNLRFGPANTTTDTAVVTLTLASNAKWWIDVVLAVQTAGISSTLRVTAMTVNGTTVALNPTVGTLGPDITVDQWVNITGSTTGAVTLTLDSINVEVGMVS